MKQSTQLNKTALLGMLALPALGFAQESSGVTVYGRIHAGLDHVSMSATPGKSAESLTRVSDNSSKLGFRGREDLGGGLSAVFQIEGGVKIDDGTGAMNSKDTYVGLDSKTYGSVMLGRFATPIRKMNDYTNRFFGEGIQDDANISQLGGEGFNRRTSNALSYRTPTFRGFSATIHRASENEASNGDRILSSMLQYANGPLKGAIGYESHKDATPGFTDKMYRAMMNYQFGGGDVGVGYNRMVYHVAAGSLERDYFTVTCSVQAGPGAVIGRIGIAADVKGSAPKGTSVEVKGTALVRGADSGAQQLTLGYQYKLSKRTQLYTYYTQTDNDQNANYAFGGNSFASVKKGAKVSGYMLGVAHIF